MKHQVARFEKVSKDQFMVDIKEEFGFRWTGEEIEKMYCKINLPTRATSGSAGYDFYAPFEFILKPGQTIKIPTGIRCHIDEGWWLGLFPRSSLGWKYKMKFDNSTPVIDEDFYFSDSEGHIILKITNNSKTTMRINAGERFCQGIFLLYGITYDDDAKRIRNGGIGSTNE